MSLKLCLAGNEPRQRHLFEALAQITDVEATLDFDEIDFFTKYMAAGLSFAWPKSEWWGNYQLHPLVQRRRRLVLQRKIAALEQQPEALLMWGSWFQPFFSRDPRAVPYYTYIDQSRSLENLPGERKSVFLRRKKSLEMQFLTYQAAGAIFCMSEWARAQTLESHALSPEKVITVGWGPCGVNLMDEDLAQVEKEPLVLHVSNDFHRKGVDFLMQTAEVVRKVIPNVRFVVIGRDSSGMIIGKNTPVEFLGPIYDKQVLTDYFRKTALFFLPHRFDRSPHVLAEAMSASLPLVATAQGGAIEVIEGQNNGFLCRAGNIDEYADAIITLLRDPGLRAQMGANGRELMIRKYNWSSIAERMVALIK